MTESEETVLETESARKHSSCYSLPGPNSPANNTADKDERSFLALAEGHCTEHLPSIFISSLIRAPRRRNSQARPPPPPKRAPTCPHRVMSTALSWWAIPFSGMLLPLSPWWDRMDFCHLQKLSRDLSA